MGVNTLSNPDQNTEQSNSNEFTQMAAEVPSFDEHMQQIGETAEKEFFEEKTEFAPDELKQFRERLLTASDEEAAALIDRRVQFLQEQAGTEDKTISPLFGSKMHRGYIGSNTQVKFEAGLGSAMASGYRIRDTSYVHDFLETFRRNKESIRNGMDVFNSIETHLNSYFGLPDGRRDRDDFIEDRLGLNNPELDDDAYFDLLNSVDLSMFRDAHVAQCSERSAMAQNLMSIMGYETYYRTGEVNVDGQQEGHAFNIVADNAGTKVLIDYSVTSAFEYCGTTYQVPTTTKIKDFDAFTSGAEPCQGATYLYEINQDGAKKRTPRHRLTYRAQ